MADIEMTRLLKELSALLEVHPGHEPPPMDVQVQAQHEGMQVVQGRCYSRVADC